ncbi:hypothetical protein ACRAWD_03570 [Caulobacter segnis]
MREKVEAAVAALNYQVNVAAPRDALAGPRPRGSASSIRTPRPRISAREIMVGGLEQMQQAGRAWTPACRALRGPGRAAGGGEAAAGGGRGSG